MSYRQLGSSRFRIWAEKPGHIKDMEVLPETKDLIQKEEIYGEI